MLLCEGKHFVSVCSLAPEDDPLCVLLMIDFYAIKACEFSFLLTVHSEWGVSTHHPHTHTHDSACM